MLRDSVTKDVVLTTKLSCLHPFFSMEAYFPLRNVITFECNLKEDRAMLWRSETDTENYRIEVKAIELRLLYVTFEQRLRERWISALAQSNLTRNIQIGRHSYFMIKSGSLKVR